MAEPNGPAQPDSTAKYLTAKNMSTPPMPGLMVPEIKQQDLGLKTLHQPENPHDVEIDVVAVHGIGASPNTTWTHKGTGKNWLSEGSMLPADLPNARIMGFGYHSVWYGESAVRKSLSGVANSLVKNLVYERKDNPFRPIIFIGHCFGGLVVKQAYNYATAHEQDARGIARSVVGIVFLGTPHQGLSDNSLLSTEGAIYSAIVKAKFQIQDNALRTMAPDSDVLVDAMHLFHMTLRRLERAPKLFCFYEVKPTKIGKVAGLHHLPPEFVINEKSGTLDSEDKEGLDLDHFNINKFEDKDDYGYKCVRNQLVAMAQASKEFVEDVDQGKTQYLSPVPLFEDGTLELEAPVSGLGRGELDV